MPKHEKQVNRDVYEGGRYEHAGRWASYYYQIKNILQTAPENVLEIGPGSGVTSWFLKSQGFKVVTMDIAEDLRPDVVADITEMPFQNDAFDTVSCCEVLEHLPFEDSVKALTEIKRVAKNYAVISIPDHRRVLLSLAIKLPFFQEKYFIIRVPSLKKHVFNGLHYWEIGHIGYPLSKIRNTLRGVGFTIEKDFTIPENPLVHFFILKK
ncbi:MAG: class I SAM-dependent methyltransferase [Patescibacteria group bacterium]|nr:class I SAM-dependent methyltransferase [Patescibacteria group bacterium]